MSNVGVLGRGCFDIQIKQSISSHIDNNCRSAKGIPILQCINHRVFIGGEGRGGRCEQSK